MGRRATWPGAAVVLLVFVHAATVARAAGGAKAAPLVANRCNAEIFATEALPAFIEGCMSPVTDDDASEERCTLFCQEALTGLLRTDTASCLAQMVHNPMMFANLGVFKDADMEKKQTDGLPDFHVTVVVDEKPQVLTRNVLATMFLDAVTMCNSEVTALNSGTCGNARYEVFTSSLIPAMLSVCTEPNAVVLRPSRCTSNCSHAYYLARNHPCFSRYFSTLDAAASNQTLSQLLDPVEAQYHASVGALHSHPDRKAAEMRTLIRNAARVCSPPSELRLNVSSCRGDAFEAYLALSVQPFHEMCADMVNKANPLERYCTVECDAFLQKVLWQPACLGMWSSREAARIAKGKGAPEQLKTLSRAIQVCAVGRGVSYSIEAQIHTDDDVPVHRWSTGVAHHPAMQSMMTLLIVFVVLFFGTIGWQQRKRCRRGAVRYQRVSTNAV